MPRRMGRPGLLGAMARTAVVAGTATAVSGRVQRGAAERDAQQQQQQAAGARQQAVVDQPPAGAAPSQDRIAQLKDLADLRATGVLTEEKFTAEKARILNS
ncbi:SHOCT domain-containing protein [Streptacidiphilus sp. PB12-B1b]|nr:SHOCT domain-containing protein [Streptacidiphilus sp. PB12-B1b]QMU80369.1 SHOCT domain-containing protein [Streptacidiphilus sp. PB12-B1b]